MENETVKQGATNEVKTFTQEEVNGIVNDRLARERKKYEGIDLEALKAKAARFDELEEANKTELEKANARADKLQAELNSIKKAGQIREIRDKVAQETGVPSNLLTAETEEECTKQAESIKAFAQPNAYPAVRDGGEPRNINKGTALNDFESWAQQALN
jgi:hypothetical protein